MPAGCAPVSDLDQAAPYDKFGSFGIVIVKKPLADGLMILGIPFLKMLKLIMRMFTVEEFVKTR